MIWDLTQERPRVSWAVEEGPSQEHSRAHDLLVLFIVLCVGLEKLNTVIKVTRLIKRVSELGTKPRYVCGKGVIQHFYNYRILSQRVTNAGNNSSKT